MQWEPSIMWTLCFRNCCSFRWILHKTVSRNSAAIDTRANVMGQIEKKDVLLSYPFESMKPFIRLLEEAAEDDRVVSIKMTLYRVAERSKIIDALVEAAENGKEVVVLVELRARFDEGNNIEGEIPHKKGTQMDFLCPVGACGNQADASDSGGEYF